MLIIGIAGGSGSGKTTVVKQITDALKDSEVNVICQDSYYRDLSNIPLEQRQKTNFDHPGAIEFELLEEHIKQLKQGKNIQQPTYSYKECIRLKETIIVEPKKVLIIEGIFALYDSNIRKTMDIKVFVDADSDDRLIRIIQRDMSERARTADMVMERYLKTVKPSHFEFIEPTKKFADIIIPSYGNVPVAINVILSVIDNKLGNSKQRF